MAVYQPCDFYLKGRVDEGVKQAGGVFQRESVWVGEMRKDVIVEFGW